MGKRRRKVLNPELAEKAKNIKGETRSTVALAAMNASSSVQPNKKRQLASSTRKEKYKPKYF